MIFKVLGEKYKAKDVNNIPIEEYDILVDNIANTKDIAELIKNILKLLTDIPKKYIDMIEDESLYQIDITKIAIPTPISTDINFDYFSIGKFIDIEDFLLNKNKDRCIARILLSNEITKTKIENFRKIKASEGLSILTAYMEWKLKIFDYFDDIIGSNDDEEESTHNHWFDLLWSLSDNDSLVFEKKSKVNFITILHELRQKKNANSKDNK